MNKNDKSYTIVDKRGMNEGQEHPEEICRVCGSQEVHSKEYGKPTMDCIKYLKDQVSHLEKTQGWKDEPYHDETGPM